jgi:two-component system, OmpR family, alkaline phosphatase synthesis response regulator PhoP
MSASILIADDDANIVLALRFLMERAGYRVTVATDGEEALRAVAEQRPDLVLLDVMMPRRNGNDVAKAIRANRALDATRIVMLTAKGLNAERSRGLHAGADAYVTKPFAIGDVLEEVRRLLDRGVAAMAGE